MCVMKLSAYLLVVVCILAAPLYIVHASDNASTEGARVGEVREFALAPGNDQVITQLHRDGWLEAHGQLLSARAYQALYKTVGRTWTADDVAEGRFAVPDLRDGSQRSLSSNNPFGVLGPGDLVSSGRAARRWQRASPVTYWIFTGQDVTRLETLDAAR